MLKKLLATTRQCYIHIYNKVRYKGTALYNGPGTEKSNTPPPLATQTHTQAF